MANKYDLINMYRTVHTKMVLLEVVEKHGRVRDVSKSLPLNNNKLNNKT